MTSELEPRIAQFRTVFRSIHGELEKMMVGQEELLEAVLVAFFADGHVLLEGVPGLGKTMLVRTLASAVNLDFSRIQFTPDLMPADIVGTRMVVEDAAGRKSFEFQRGPLFAHIVLADEINRATPKTQSALLQAMQEGHVTVGGISYPLQKPFLVLATQNPLEMEGTYALPEAQLDRFFFKLQVPYPTAEDLHTILDRTTQAHTPAISKVLQGAGEIDGFRELVRMVPIAREVQEHAVNLVLATHPTSNNAVPMAKKYVRYGASPRGAQALIIAGKIHALLDNRFHVSKADISMAALPALRHRIILNFEAEAAGISSDSVIAEALS